MNRATTIPGALLLLGTGIIYTLGETIMKNQDVMELLAVVSVMAAVAIAFTWGYVEFYKRGQFTPEVIQAISKPFTGKGIDPYARERNLTYNRAVAAGVCVNLALGVVFLLIEGATVKEYIVIAVCWTVWSGVIGFSVPWAWRIVFYHMRPSRKRTEEDVESKL